LDTNIEIEQKYHRLGENTETYIQGLLRSKPITYLDYVAVDALRSLQKPRTHFKDETIFIMYYQLSELLLKMMRHEGEQIIETEIATEVYLIHKTSRLNRYDLTLITSFDFMKDGTDYDDYNDFRKTWTPASGFQSAQFRYIEMLCTRLENLVHDEGKKRLPTPPVAEDYFDHIYWIAAGLNRKTGKKTLTLIQFEEKYLESFIGLAKKVHGKTLMDKILCMNDMSSALRKKLREFDRLYNDEWPLVHLRTAEHFLNRKGENKAATGGSEWKKPTPKIPATQILPGVVAKKRKRNMGRI
jgi:tryptophan 2,3-dioxygenase